MLLPQANKPMYTDLRQKLIEFKNANSQDRKKILLETRDSLNQLNEMIGGRDEAIDAYRKLAYAATLFNYVNALGRIDNQEFFDILATFKMPEQFEKPEFQELKNYFEFHPKAPQMRLLKPRTEIPKDIWKLFREAQKAKLQGSSVKFNLDELDIDNLPEDQLYPLPIQMFGKYLNEAVDRVWGSASGEYTFANSFGLFLLPGGGMVEVDLEKTRDKILLKMLDEHLEELHGNLYSKAAQYYNEVEQDKCFAVLMHCTVDNEKLKPEFREKLMESFQATKGTSNSNIIQGLVQTIDDLMKQYPDNLDAKRELNVLRATVQVDPLKLTALYQEAAHYIKDNSVLARIEQFGDTRACGGKQISNTYLMFGEDLLTWFEHKFDGCKAETGDDIKDSKLERMSLLKTLEIFPKIKFSHLLIVLAHQIESLERGTMQFENIWNKEQYTRTRMSLLNGATEAIKAIEKKEGFMHALVAGPGFLANQRYPLVEDKKTPNIYPKM